MKKYLALFLAGLMVLSFCACGASAPPPKAEDTVIAFSDAMKAFDTVKMGTYLIENEDLEDEIEAEDEYTALFLDKFKEWAQKIAYEVVSAEEQGEDATVEVKYTFTDSTPIIASFFEEYLIQAFSLAFSGGTEEEIGKIAEDILVDKLATVEPGTAENTIKYSLRMVDKEWKIVGVPDEVVDVLSANLSVAFNAIDDAFSSDGEVEETIAETAESGVQKENEIEVSVPDMTMGEKNALGSAKTYLAYSAFSYMGLIEQLEYEGYSEEEGRFAADNCGADWNEQALKSAKTYLSYSAFSYTGLIEQLEYEQFTHEQAVYGADNCGADWFEQAAKSAKNYLSFMSFSKQGLIEQLEYEGFTHEQAQYGVEQNGY